MLTALVSPASLLAEEVRTGKLGGLCQVSPAAFDANGPGDAAPAGSHCDMCGSPGIAMPPGVAQALPGQLAAKAPNADVPFGLAVLVQGLPPSRGPPAL